MTGFAHPLNKLRESGLGVAVTPTGGMGLALAGNGTIPSPALPLRFGVSTLTWPGGQNFSTEKLVTHGLNGGNGIVPKAGQYAILTTPRHFGSSGISAGVVIEAHLNSTTLQVLGWTSDGSNPANGSTAEFFWLVIVTS